MNPQPHAIRQTTIEKAQGALREINALIHSGGFTTKRATDIARSHQTNGGLMSLAIEAGVFSKNGKVYKSNVTTIEPVHARLCIEAGYKKKAQKQPSATRYSGGGGQGYQPSLGLNKIHLLN